MMITDVINASIQKVKDVIGIGKNNNQDLREEFIFTGSDKPEYADDLIKLVNDEFQRRKEERRPFELQWRLNIEFYVGNQFVKINTVSNAVEEQPLAYWWQEREVFNQIAPLIDTRLAKLSRMRPILKVRPATNQMEDVSAAKVSTKLLRSTRKSLNLKEKQDSANTWAELTGTVFWKHAWNPEKGKLLGVIDFQTGQEIREGDVEQFEVPPYEIFPESSWIEDLEEQRSIIHAKPMHVQEIKETWGKDVDPEDVNVLELEKTKFGNGSLVSGSGSYMRGVKKKKDHAIVKEYMERPSKKYPNGRLIIVANNVLLYAGDLPYAVGEDGKRDFPITKQICLRRPGCFWGITVLERLIPVQRRYNKIKNRIAEYIERVTVGQMVVEKDTVDIDDLEEDAAAPGKIFEVNKGATKYPEYIKFPELPVSLREEEVKCLDDFSRISGVSEISRNSDAPTGINSGIALQIALEQDDTRLSRAVENIIDATIKNGKITLRLYKQFVNYKRVTRYVNNDDEVQAIHWDRNDLRSEDIIIENIAALTESPAQRRQMVFDLLSAGLYNDPETGRLTREGRNKVFELLEMGNWESYDDMEQLQISRAERENQMLMQGQFVGIADYDDDAIHIQRHNRFRLTTDYEELINGPNGVYFEQIFAAHIEQHIIKLQMQAQQFLSQQQTGEQPILPAPQAGQPA